MALVAPVVPASVQHAIVVRAPALAFVPARVAIGYRYRTWTFSGSVVRIRFRNDAKREIVFVASRQHGACTRGAEKTFQMAGNKVYWRQRADEQEAWRCVDGVQLTAATAQAPTAFADVGVGRVAASAHRIR